MKKRFGQILLILAGLVGGGGAAAFGVLLSLDSYNNAVVTGDGFTIFYGLIGVGLIGFFAFGVVPLITLAQEMRRPSKKRPPAETPTRQDAETPPAAAAPAEAEDRQVLLAGMAARVMAATAAVDGDLQSSEVAVIAHAVRDAFGARIDPETIEAFHARALKNADMLERNLTANRQALTSDERRKLFKAAVMVAFADGAVVDEERDALSRIGALLDLEAETQGDLAQAAISEVRALTLSASGP